MNIITMIRQANQPGIPENSVRFRLACTGAVLVAIQACASLSELSRPTAWGAMALVSGGTIFSYFTRGQPPGWIKLLVAVAAVGAMGWFIHQVSATSIPNIIAVEDPLAVLVVFILAIHSFHLPARRDLLFSLGASAGLMAVGAAQAIDLRFGFYALAWVGFSLWSMVERWGSASGGGRLSARDLVVMLASVTILAVATFLVLPAPTVGVKIGFLDRKGSGGSVGVPGALAGDGGDPAALSRAGTPSGPTRVGGYLGFAGSLDTALRGKLSHALVMWVRAQRPSFWVGETFDSWNGQSWTTTRNASIRIDLGASFALPRPEGGNAAGQADLQTFYVNTATADLVFHAESAAELWFPASDVSYSSDGTLVSPIGLGRGAVYTVESQVIAPTSSELRAASDRPPLPPVEEGEYTQLPHAYPQVEALARSVTSGATNNYGRVEDLIAWIGLHTRYSLQIPPLPAGADTVDEFLFGSRVGFCEQISTSLAVMLRTLGIPAREAVGYVPGSYNPITDLYGIRADDAHAWVQVWMPGYGWQSFDPTASVPDANPAPGASALTDAGRALGHVPVLPVSALLVAAAVAVATVRRRRRRPANWAEHLAGLLERAGRRAGHPRRPAETLVEYGEDLDRLSGDTTAPWAGLATKVEASVYGGRQPSLEAQRGMIALARRSSISRYRSLTRARNPTRRSPGVRP